MKIAEFQKNLQSGGALVENPVDLFYLTGLQLSRGILAVTPHEAALFVDGRYMAYAKDHAPCPVHSIEGDAAAQFLKQRGGDAIAFDSAYTTYDGYLALQKQMNGAKLIPCSALLKEQRMRKSPAELSALKKAADLTRGGLAHVSGLFKEGVTEEQLAFEFENYVRRHGASGLSFEPIVAFGENSAYPHHRAGKTKLKQGQLILVDVGAVADHYRGDMTRVYFFGQVDPELEKMLHWTKRAQQAAIAAVRPGIHLKEVDQAARDVLRKEGVEEFFTHSLGHGIGLETHEFPSFKKGGSDYDLLLEPGMVFTIEPGLYRPGLGGVRWEDVVCVTEDSAKIC